MPKVNVYDMQGNVVGEIELDSNIFGVEINTHCMHAAVVNNLANKRQGTHSTLLKSEVSGGGRKPEGNGPRKTGQHKIRAVDPRRYRVRAETERLQLLYPQKDETAGSEIVPYEQGERRRYHRAGFSELRRDQNQKHGQRASESRRGQYGACRNSGKRFKRREIREQYQRDRNGLCEHDQCI